LKKHFQRPTQDTNNWRVRDLQVEVGALSRLLMQSGSSFDHYLTRTGNREAIATGVATLKSYHTVSDLGTNVPANPISCVILFF
jgi:hypothetical protein